MSHRSGNPTWENYPSSATPVTAEALEAIELEIDTQGESLEELADTVANLEIEVGGTHPVASVNGKTGAVVLTASDVGAASAEHEHEIADVDGLQAALDAKAAASHTHSTSQITAFAEAVQDTVAASLVAGANITITYNDAANTITISASGGEGGGAVDSVNGKTGVVVLSASDVGAAAASHSHTTSDVTGLQTALDGKANATHSHTISDVTGLQDALDGKANTTHSHTISDVSGLQDALDGKASTSHTHTPSSIGAADAEHTHGISDVTGLQTALDDLVVPTATEETAGKIKLAAAADVFSDENTTDAITPATMHLASGTLVSNALASQVVGTGEFAGLILQDDDTLITKNTNVTLNEVSVSGPDGSTSLIPEGLNFGSMPNPTYLRPQAGSGVRTVNLPAESGTLALTSEVPVIVIDPVDESTYPDGTIFLYTEE